MNIASTSQNNQNSSSAHTNLLEIDYSLISEQNIHKRLLIIDLAIHEITILFRYIMINLLGYILDYIEGCKQIVNI